LRGRAPQCAPKREGRLGTEHASKQKSRAARPFHRSTPDLSRRTEQQAASLEKTAGALNAITATVKTTANGAVEARKMVGLAKAQAEQSDTVVKEPVRRPKPRCVAGQGALKAQPAGSRRQLLLHPLRQDLDIDGLGQEGDAGLTF